MKALTDYTSTELIYLQLALSVAYHSNCQVFGKEAESNLAILRWADEVSAALKEVVIEEQIKEEVQQ